MIQYNTVNIKVSNSKQNKLKSEVKNGIKVALNVSSNVVNDSNDETDFPRKLLLTNTPLSRLCKAFVNGCSLTNVKLLRTQLSKMVQSGELISRLFGFDPLKIVDTLLTPFELYRDELMKKICS